MDSVEKKTPTKRNINPPKESHGKKRRSRNIVSASLAAKTPDLEPKTDSLKPKIDALNESNDSADQTPIGITASLADKTPDLEPKTNSLTPKIVALNESNDSADQTPTVITASPTAQIPEPKTDSSTLKTGALNESNDPAAKADDSADQTPTVDLDPRIIDREDGTNVNLTPKAANPTSDNGFVTPNQARQLSENPSTPLGASWLRRLLVKSLEGRIILQFYDKHRFLPPKKRKTLVKIIILSEIDEDPATLISPERFQRIAAAICECFDGEIYSTYYIPYHRDPDGSQHLAKGKLQDKYIYVRRTFRKDGTIVGKQLFPDSIDSEIDDDQNAVDPLLEAQRRWLKVNSHSDSRTDIEEVFKKTYHVRLAHYRKNKLEIADYFHLYEGLRKDKAYTLINIDFNVGFPNQGNGDALITKWDDFEEKILKLGKRRAKYEGLQPLLSNLGIDLTIEDSQTKTINSLLLLPALLPLITSKKHWRVSYPECVNAFILIGEDSEEIQRKLLPRLQTFEKNNQPIVPVIQLIGKGGKFQIFVFIKDIYIEFDSILKAVDCCFKIFKILNEAYPPDCLLPWSFLEEYVYEMCSTLHLKYPALGTLDMDLKTVRLYK